jgi:hypothetical protein
MAHRVLEAADRGVRVRLLVDDMDARAKNAGFAGLDAHPRIAVRMFDAAAVEAEEAAAAALEAGEAAGGEESQVPDEELDAPPTGGGAPPGER